VDVDAVAFEDLNDLSCAGDVSGGVGFEPTAAEAKRVTSEGSWLFQILAEPRSQHVQFIRVATRDVLPLQRLCCCLNDSLLNMTVLVFAADDKRT